MRASKYFKVKSLSFRSFVGLKECILASLLLNTAIYRMSCKPLTPLPENIQLNNDALLFVRLCLFSFSSPSSKHFDWLYSRRNFIKKIKTEDSKRSPLIGPVIITTGWLD